MIWFYLDARQNKINILSAWRQKCLPHRQRVFKRSCATECLLPVLGFLTVILLLQFKWLTSIRFSHTQQMYSKCLHVILCCVNANAELRELIEEIINLQSKNKWVSISFSLLQKQHTSSLSVYLDIRDSRVNGMQNFEVYFFL